MQKKSKKWSAGNTPVAVIMLSLNEGHNMRDVLENLQGWAQEVFLVDSFSSDDTLDIAREYGVKIIQKSFEGFGDQWNFALRELPISASWTMKLDPDERLTDELKINISKGVLNTNADGMIVSRHLWFMQETLPIHQNILRVWRTGRCHFTDVTVNEHPVVNGSIVKIRGVLDHLDSPNLDHWLEKQNRYGTLEAIISYTEANLADKPVLFGTPLQRRMFLKKNFSKIPFRFILLFIYYYFFKRLWSAGKVGYIWSRLRVDVMRYREYKYFEMKNLGHIYSRPHIHKSKE
jgi:glycosyltransferase involved in cell wall biosynthesis